MPKTHGFRAGTRAIMRKGIREKGMRPPAYLLQEYKVGDKVLVKINSTYHKGMPHRRYHGKVGTVIAPRGRAYVLRVRSMEKLKDIIVRPEHIVPYGES